MTSPAANRQTYLLIASCSYSGSTMLASLLNAHPDVTALGGVSSARREARMESFRCSCGMLMTDCSFWRQVAAGMHRAGYPDFRLANFELGFDPSSHTLGARLLYGSLRLDALERARDMIAAGLPAHRARMSAIGRRNRDFAQVALDSTGTRVLVDTSKERMRARDLGRWLGMDLRVIHLVRDPRGVVDSSLRRGRDGGDERAAALRWTKINSAILRGVARLPPARRMLLRYEELCAAPEASLSRIYRFCGLEPGAGRPGDGPTPAHLLGNRVRFVGTGEIRLDERWRENLDTRQVERIHGVTRGLEQRLAGGEDQPALSGLAGG